MILRRAALLLWLLLGLLGLWALCTSPAGRSLTLPVIARGPAGAAGWLTRLSVETVNGALGAAASPARAEEVLEFRRVPDESLATIDHAAPPAPPAPPHDTLRVIKRIGEGRSGNVMRIGSDVHVERDQVISGDLLAVGGDVTVDGHVEGDVVAMGGDVKLNSTARVDGDVASIGGELTEEPGASIGGQRVTARGLSGTRALRHRTRRMTNDFSFALVGKIVSGLIWMFVFALIAWGFASLAPGRTGRALERLQREPGLSIGIGALVWALIIPSIVALALVVAILCITIIGIPLALAALFGYFVFLGVLAAWGFAVAALAVGALAIRKTGVGAPVPLAGAAPAVSLSRKAVIGVLVFGLAGLAGDVLHAMFFVPPLQGLGAFISVLAKIGAIVAATFGAGALLRSEAASGTFRRIWGMRGAVPGVPAPAPAAPSVPAAGVPSGIVEAGTPPAGYTPPPVGGGGPGGLSPEPPPAAPGMPFETGGAKPGEFGGETPPA